MQNLRRSWTFHCRFGMGNHGTPLAVSWHHPPGQALDTRACSHQKHPALSWAQGEPYLELQGEQGSTGDLHGKLAWYSPHSHCCLSYEIALKRYKIGHFQLSVIHAKIYHTLFTHICLPFGCYGMNYTLWQFNIPTDSCCPFWRWLTNMKHGLVRVSSIPWRQGIQGTPGPLQCCPPVPAVTHQHSTRSYPRWRPEKFIKQKVSHGVPRRFQGAI